MRSVVQSPQFRYWLACTATAMPPVDAFWTCPFIRLPRISQAQLVRLDLWGEPDAPRPFPDFQTTAQISRSTTHKENGVQACRAVLQFDSTRP